MKKGVKIVIGAVVVLAIGAGVLSRLSKPAEELVTKPVPSVVLTQAAVGDVEAQTALMGSVQPSDTYYVMPKVAGEIREIFVENGDSVEAGDPICRLDNDKQIDAARIQLEGAAGSYNTAQDALNRMTPLYQAGDVSEQSYQQTVAQVKGAKYQMDAAQLSYDTQVEFATVTAPASGVVQNAAMTLNAMAAQSSQLCVITASGAKTVNFNVTEAVLGGIALGDPVTVEKQGSSYTGSITDISTLANAQTGLFAVKAALDSSAQALPDGTSCKVSLVTERAQGAELLPVDCIYYSGGNPYVYTYQDGTARRAFVTLGVTDGVNVQIVDGLDPAAQVIASWTQELYDGASVQLASEADGQAAADETTAQAGADGAGSGEAETAASQDGAQADGEVTEE